MSKPENSYNKEEGYIRAGSQPIGQIGWAKAVMKTQDDWVSSDSFWLEFDIIILIFKQ